MKTALPILITVTLALFAVRAGAQQPTASVSMQTPSATQVAPSPAERMQNMPMMSDTESMKRMADMCQQMMKKQEAAMPFVIGSFVVFGVLLFIALVLLAVLEVLWIKHWSGVLKREPRT